MAQNSHRNFSLCKPLHFHLPSVSLSIPHYDFWGRDFLKEMVLCDLAIPQESLLSHRISSNYAHDLSSAIPSKVES